MRPWLAALAVCLCACDSYHYHYGRFLEGTHHELKALEHYEAYSGKDRRSAEVNVRAGRLYAQLQRCLEARRHFESAARQFPNLEPWATRAKAGIMDCPDYFPLGSVKSWTLGDSASGGKFARDIFTLSAEADGATAKIHSELFAGQKKIRSDDVAYEKRDWGVFEVRGAEKALILRYPFRKGEAWSTTRDGTRLEFRIESEDATVKTKAGVFKRCLKVRQFDPRNPDAWTYDYFAPFIGRVMTSVAGPDFENPNLELIKTGS